MADEKGKDEKGKDKKGKDDQTDSKTKGKVKPAPKHSPEEEDKAIDDFTAGLPEGAVRLLTSSGRAAQDRRP